MQQIITLSKHEAAMIIAQYYKELQQKTEKLFTVEMIIQIEDD